MPVALKSRIPQIIGSLPDATEEAIQSATEEIAQDASDRAPVASGELKDSIEAREGSSGYGIWAAWYWFFTEFGTTNAPANPYMLPAWEAGRDKLLEEVENALEDL